LDDASISTADKDLMLGLRLEVVIDEGTNCSCDVQQCGCTESIVNEPLDEVLDGGVMGMSSLFTVYRYGIA